MKMIQKTLLLFAISLIAKVCLIVSAVLGVINLVFHFIDGSPLNYLWVSLVVLFASIMVLCPIVFVWQATKKPKDLDFPSGGFVQEPKEKQTVKLKEGERVIPSKLKGSFQERLDKVMEIQKKMKDPQ